MHKRKWYAAAFLLVLAMAAYRPFTNAVYAARLMMAVRSLASGSVGNDLPVLMEKIGRPRGSGHLDALVYHPAGGSVPSRAAVLVPGISELGCYHPRLMALSRSMADKGFLVLTPDIVMFREFRMSPEAMDEIQFWFEQVPRLGMSSKDVKTGLAGISFSGTLALITAARPEIRDRVAWVLAIGAYDDPMRCSREWFAAGSVTVGPEYYPTRYYARWIVMLAALDMVADADDRTFLDSALADLLLQRKIPAPRRPLGTEAARFYRLATMRENEQDPELAAAIESFLRPRIYEQINPSRAVADVRCPVFLVHGAQDDLIPPSESRRLYEQIRSRSSLLISPFLTHTHPNEKTMTLGERAAAALDIFRFFYAFAATAR